MLRRSELRLCYCESRYVAELSFAGKYGGGGRWESAEPQPDKDKDRHRDGLGNLHHVAHLCKPEKGRKNFPRFSEPSHLSRARCEQRLMHYLARSIDPQSKHVA